MSKKNIDDLAQIDDLEITPLSDDELAFIAGGWTDSTTEESCQCCAETATNHTKLE